LAGSFGAVAMKKNRGGIMSKRGNTTVKVATSLLALSAAISANKAWAQQASVVEEVVVTAERRAESLQKVPIAVQAFNQKQLTQALVKDTADLTKITPGLNFFNDGVGSAQIFIRGVGRNSITAGQEASVPVYVDGVYYASGVGQLTSLDDAQQVEILKGPQGTLYGRNATGGLISITTLTPQATPMVHLKAGYESYNTTDDSIYVTGAITNNLYASISGDIHYQDEGYGRAIYVDHRRDNYVRYGGVRAKLLWKPTDSDTVNLGADFYNDLSKLGVAASVLPGTFSSQGAPPPPSPWDSQLARLQHAHAENYGGSLQWEHDFGNNLVFKSLSAYRNAFYISDNYALGLGPKLVATINAQQKIWSFQQEFLLQGETGPFNYTAGLFYLTDGDKQPVSVALTALPLTQVVPSKTLLQSYSGFAQVDYRFTDRDTLTLGGRYTIDRRAITAGAGTIFAGHESILYASGHKEFSDFTWRAALKHEFSNELMAYVSANKGFNSGVYNAAGALTPTGALAPPVRPEILYAYEGGVKSSLFDNHLQLNGAGYYYDFSDLQVMGFSPSGIGGTVLSNAAKAEIYGAEISGVAAIPVAVGQLNLRAGASFVHARYDSYPGCTIYIAHNTFPFITQVPTLPLTNCAGNQLIQTPSFTFSTTPSYTVPLERIGGSLEMSMTYYHSSGYYYNPGNNQKLHPYDMLDAEITYAFPDGRTRLQVYGSNLTNAAVGAIEAETTLGFNIQGYLPPRVFGVRFDYRFGGAPPH
jgi:iron complex outermembrane receptor protein